MDHSGTNRRTLLRIFGPILGSNFSSCGEVAGTLAAAGATRKSCQSLSENQTASANQQSRESHRVANRKAATSAGQSPETRAGLRQISLNQWHQIVARPTAACPDRFPVAQPDRFPISDCDCLRARNHHRISRHMLELVPIFFAHRPSFDKLLARRSNHQTKDRRQAPTPRHTRSQKAQRASAKARVRASHQKVCRQRRDRRQPGKEVAPVNRSAVVEKQQQIGQQTHRAEQEQTAKACARAIHSKARTARK